MFELTCFNCETITLKDGKVFYRLWFNLTNGGLCWLTSNKYYAPGDSVQIEVVPAFTNDTKTNMRMNLRVVSK